MTSDPVTLTLPFLTWQGAYVLLTAFGILIATGLVWLMLNGAERKHSTTLESWAKAVAWVLGPAWVYPAQTSFNADRGAAPYRQRA